MYDVTPFTSRIETDCGSTCLKMLLHFYGIDVPLDQLIRECNTKINGCSSSDIKRAAKLHDVQLKAYKMDFCELIKCDRPAIVWWLHRHWCVFCGLENDNVILCDPDKGRFGLPRGIFKAMYSGIAMFNGEPNDDADTSTVAERLTESETVAGMAYVNSEINSALIELLME